MDAGYQRETRRDEENKNVVYLQDRLDSIYSVRSLCKVVNYIYSIYNTLVNHLF